jgi:PAS domain S-box-containing protein
VAPIIQTYPFTLAPGISVLVAIKLMSQARTSYALVVEQEQLLGLFTQQDLIQKVAPGLDLSAIKIADLITHSPIVLKASEVETPLAVLQQMQHYQICHFPIVDEQDKLIGVISLESVLEALTEPDPDDRTVGQKQIELPREAAAFSSESDFLTMPDSALPEWLPRSMARDRGVPNSTIVAVEATESEMGNPFLSCPILSCPIDSSSATVEIHQQHEAWFAAMVDQAPIGITLIDPRSQRHLETNQQFCQMLGYSQTELQQLSWQTLVHPDAESDDLLSHLNHAIQMESRWSGEGVLQRKDGSSFPSWVMLSPVYDDRAVLIGMMGIAIDITQQKQTAIALQQARDHALQEAAQSATANRAKSEFLSRMSHELRTPLTSILGFAELVAADPRLSQASCEHLKIIRRSGKHLLSLINDVLEISRIEAGQLTLKETSIDLYHLLDSLEELFQLKATSQGLELNFERGATVPQHIQTDENKLRQVLINILGNAFKFTQQGKMTLRVKRLLITELPAALRPKSSSQVLPQHRASWHDIDAPSLQRLATDSVLYFEVEDTGCGIAPEEIGQIFEAFVQTECGHNLQEGSTGLGLAISRQFVTLMGGKITARSQVGQGSLFSFYVQLTLTQGGMPRSPVLATPRVIGLEPNQPTFRILLADDELFSRKILNCLLKPLGFEVREAKSGTEAIALYETWQPHLIWMDMQMPEMDGYEATRQIRNLEICHQSTSLPALDAAPTSPIIIALTASTFDEQQARAMAAGCNDFLAKPFSTKTILDKLATYLGVRYRYAEPQTPEECQIDTAPIISFCPVTFSAAFATMPSAWQSELRAAARRLSSTQCLRLIQQIPATQATLAQNLTELVENFQFDILMDLIRSQP